VSIDPVIIFGAGGHAAVVVDAVPRGTKLLILDESYEGKGTKLLDWSISAPARPVDVGTRAFHVAIGDNRARAAVMAQILAGGARPYSVIHAKASVAPSATIGAGCFIAGMAVVAPRAELGPAVIVNHGAVVDHDCCLGEFCHIAPNATLGGGVTIGAHALVGAGAVILPGVVVGNGATIGAGSVVTKDVPTKEVWSGVPARKREAKNR
jgi:sugar O-acyltransferase (sialic acid O-acetyltransferase NeuD family)